MFFFILRPNNVTQELCDTEKVSLSIWTSMIPTYKEFWIPSRIAENDPQSTYPVSYLAAVFETGYNQVTQVGFKFETILLQLPLTL